MWPQLRPCSWPWSEWVLGALIGFFWGVHSKYEECLRRGFVAQPVNFRPEPRLSTTMLFWPETNIFERVTLFDSHSSERAQRGKAATKSSSKRVVVLLPRVVAQRLEGSRFGACFVGPREFVPSRTRPTRAAAGGSRERPRGWQLYRVHLNESKAAVS